MFWGCLSSEKVNDRSMFINMKVRNQVRCSHLPPRDCVTAFSWSSDNRPVRQLSSLMALLVSWKTLTKQHFGEKTEKRDLEEPEGLTAVS